MHFMAEGSVNEGIREKTSFLDGDDRHGIPQPCPVIREIQSPIGPASSIGWKYVGEDKNIQMPLCAVAGGVLHGYCLRQARIRGAIGHDGNRADVGTIPDRCVRHSS